MCPQTMDVAVERLQKVGCPSPCSPIYRALTFPLVGFPPTEHTSLRWTHTRACDFHRTRLTKEGTLQETSISPTPRTSPWSAYAFIGYLCTVFPTLFLRAFAMYAAFPRSDSYAPFDCL